MIVLIFCFMVILGSPIVIRVVVAAVALFVFFYKKEAASQSLPETPLERDE